jgi:hypothetical protein
MKLKLQTKFSGMPWAPLISPTLSSTSCLSVQSAPLPYPHHTTVALSTTNIARGSSLPDHAGQCVECAHYGLAASVTWCCQH